MRARSARATDLLVRIVSLICVTLASLGTGCERPDIGKECPKLLANPPTAGGTRIETNEVVAQDFQFDCDELICVATDGRTGYCSAKCREDVGCPPGFECRQVQTIGEFANDKFCVWKRCEQPKDCGNHDDFRCCHPSVVDQCGGEVEGLTLATGEDIKLCTFRE